MSLVVGLDGTPLASPQILERLKQIDPSLGLRFVRLPPPMESHWAVTMKWRLDDERRRLVQEGKIGGDDGDIVSRLQIGCGSVEAYGYICRNFVRASKDHMERLISRIDKYNEQAHIDNTQETNDLADELIEENAPTLFRELGKTSARFRGGFMDLKGKDD